MKHREFTPVPPKDDLAPAAENNLSGSSERTGTPHVPDHELLRPIGNGSYGEVWLARNIMGTYRAVKFVYRQRFEEARPFDREFNGVKTFEPVSRMHDGFVDILQVGRNEKEGYFYSVMELADPRDGSAEINPDTYEPKTAGAIVATGNPLPYEECLVFGLAVSSALAFLHKRGLVHRDIKPSNLIIVNGRPKLADVGMVTQANSASIAGGTLGYMAPEGLPSAQADVYALGKVLYELSTGLDRMKHPAPPAFWREAPNLAQLTELNEVVLKACEPDLARRYASGEEVYNDLILLQTGESVKRLLSLERLVRLTQRAALVGFAVALLVGYEFFRVYQASERESKRVADVHAAEGARLASKGDFLAALPWYAEALQLDRNRPSRSARHRMNLQTAIRYSPRIVRMLFEENDVYDAAFSPNGQEVAEAFRDGRVLVRRVDKLDSFYELLGHGDKVQSVSWNFDGKYLLSASADRTARVWNTESHRWISVFEHPGEVLWAGFSSNGNHVLTVGAAGPKGEDGLVRLWPWNSSNHLAEHTQPGLVHTAAFSPDDSLIASGGEDGFLRLLENPQLNPRKTLLRHPRKAGAENWVYGTAFSADGKYLATAASDGARVWEVSSWELLSFFPYDAPVSTVAFSPDGQYLLTGADDYTARIWDLQRRVEAFPPLRHNSFVRKASFSSDGRLVLTATVGGVITIWDLAPKEWKPLGLAIYSPDGRSYAQIASNSVQVYNAALETPSGPPISSSGKIRDCRFTQDGNRLLVVCEDATRPAKAPLWAQLYSADGTLVGIRFGLPNFVPELSDHSIASLSSNGYRIAITLGSAVQLWDAKDGRMVRQTIQLSSTAKAAVSPDGTRLLAYCSKQVLLFDGSTGTSIRVLPHPEYADCAKFSPNSKILVTGCRDNGETASAAYIWNARDGEKIGPNLEHQDGIADLAFSSDGKFLLTAGEDRVVIQWRVDTWKEVRRFLYDCGFNSAVFNRDGTRVATTASDDTLRLWDAESGLPLTPPLKHLYNLWDARFVGNGDRVLSKRLMLDRWALFAAETAATNTSQLLGRHSPLDWEKSIWLLEDENKNPDDLRMVAELLSGHRIQFDHTTSLSKSELRDHWRNVTRSKSSQFDFAPGEIVAWHQQQLERAHQEQDAVAALFHQSRIAQTNAEPLASIQVKSSH
jgi:WD40 repeat protein